MQRFKKHFKTINSQVLGRNKHISLQAARIFWYLGGKCSDELVQDFQSLITLASTHQRFFKIVNPYLRNCCKNLPTLLPAMGYKCDVLVWWPPASAPRTDQMISTRFNMFLALGMALDAYFFMICATWHTWEILRMLVLKLFLMKANTSVLINVLIPQNYDFREQEEIGPALYELRRSGFLLISCNWTCIMFIRVWRRWLHTISKFYWIGGAVWCKQTKWCNLFERLRHAKQKITPLRSRRNILRRNLQQGYCLQHNAWVKLISKRWSELSSAPCSWIKTSQSQTSSHFLQFVHSFSDPEQSSSFVYFHMIILAGGSQLLLKCRIRYSKPGILAHVPGM